MQPSYVAAELPAAYPADSSVARPANCPIGETFVARQEFQRATHCFGYLEVAVGDSILLLHAGDDRKSEEKDWIYGEKVHCRQRGWLPKCCHVPVAALATAGEIFVARQEAVHV